MPAPGSNEMDDQQIEEALHPFGVSLKADQIAKILEYMRLLLRWNRSLNLTTITNPIDIVVRHFGESMYVVRLLPVENCRLVDIGTGAGFPGLALKIACPSIGLELIESNKKKCAFLAAVVRDLEFTNVEIRCERFEEIRPQASSANIITSRAVGDFKQLLRWSSGALLRGGHLVLWVGAEDSTRIASNPGWNWQPPTRIPESQRRFILIGWPADRISEPP